MGTAKVVAFQKTIARTLEDKEGVDNGMLGSWQEVVCSGREETRPR